MPDPDQHERRTYPITTLLLLAVNLPLAGLVAVLLVNDYRREMRRATDVRRVMLTHEAGLIGTAISNLSDTKNDSAAIERFLEGSCAGSAGEGNPGHWIDVSLKGQKIHSHTGPTGTGVTHASPTSGHGDSDHAEAAVAGRYSSNGLTVEVSEIAADIRRSVRSEVLMHISSLVALAALAALMVDVALVRLVAKPTQRLATAVSHLEPNQFKMTPEKFRSRELSTLSSAISAMADSLQTAHANHDIAMQRAKQIQTHLLPQDLKVPGLALASHYQPAEEVAGDIYGVMKMRDGSWLIYIADLVGHGIPAAMSASVLKMVIESAARDDTEPAAMMNRVNQALPHYLAEGEFATGAILRWQPDTGELVYASAGHEPLLLLSGDTVDTLESTGLPLCIDVSLQWEQESIQLSPGDRLLLCTDGISEASNHSDEMYGRDRIKELMIQRRNIPVAEFTSQLADRVNDHIGDLPSQDDITLLVIERVPDSDSESNMDA